MATGTIRLHRVLARACRARLSGVSGSGRHGQVASALRLHLQGPADGCHRGRHLQDVVRELRDGPGPLLRRRVPRAGAVREDPVHGPVRRPEPAGRDADDGDAEEGVVRNGVSASCRKGCRRPFRSRCAISAGRNRSRSWPRSSSPRFPDDEVTPQAGMQRILPVAALYLGSIPSADTGALACQANHGRRTP